MTNQDDEHGQATDLVDGAAILAEPVYRRLRVAVVVEPDALANALFSHFECAQAGEVYQSAIPPNVTRTWTSPSRISWVGRTPRRRRSPWSAKSRTVRPPGWRASTGSP
jgi:hypothetical protein